MIKWRPEILISYWEWVLATQIIMVSVFIASKYYIPSGWRGNVAAFSIGVLN